MGVVIAGTLELNERMSYTTHDPDSMGTYLTEIGGAEVTEDTLVLLKLVKPVLEICEFIRQMAQLAYS